MERNHQQAQQIMKKHIKQHIQYPGMKDHINRYVNHSLKSFDKHLRSCKLSNSQKDELMATHILLIKFLNDTYKKEPWEINRILMKKRIKHLIKIRQSNIINNPNHYATDDLDGWEK